VTSPASKTSNEAEREKALESVREALSHPHHVAALPTNDVVELRMPKSIYDDAFAALDTLATEFRALEEQREALMRDWAKDINGRRDERLRAERAEAEVARLREATETKQTFEALRRAIQRLPGVGMALYEELDAHEAALAREPDEGGAG